MAIMNSVAAYIEFSLLIFSLTDIDYVQLCKYSREYPIFMPVFFFFPCLYKFLCSSPKTANSPMPVKDFLMGPTAAVLAISYTCKSSLTILTTEPRGYSFRRNSNNSRRSSHFPGHIFFFSLSAYPESQGKETHFQTELAFLTNPNIVAPTI